MPPKLAVADGAVLRCSAGLTPSTLTVTTDPFSVIEGHLIATILDNKPAVNVKPFGLCAITQKPCVPVTPAPWQPGGIGIATSLFTILSDNSFLACSVGGNIEVLNPGQATLFVDAPPSLLELERIFSVTIPPGASLIYDAAGNPVGYAYSEAVGIMKFYDADGIQVGIYETPLEEVGDLTDAIMLFTGIGSIGRMMARKMAARLAVRAAAKEAAEVGARQAERRAADQIAKNLKRFERKLPRGAEPTKTYDLPNGGKAFQAKDPGRVPGSYAVYEKQVDATGQTMSFTKTTYTPDGRIAHVKIKFPKGQADIYGR